MSANEKQVGDVNYDLMFPMVFAVCLSCIYVMLSPMYALVVHALWQQITYPLIIILIFLSVFIPGILITSFVPFMFRLRDWSVAIHIAIYVVFYYVSAAVAFTTTGLGMGWAALDTSFETHFVWALLIPSAALLFILLVLFVVSMHILFSARSAQATPVNGGSQK